MYIHVCIISYRFSPSLKAGHASSTTLWCFEQVFGSSLETIQTTPVDIYHTAAYITIDGAAKNDQTNKFVSHLITSNGLCRNH